MRPPSVTDRRATIATLGGHGAVIDEVAAYCESPFDPAAVQPFRFPLPDEPHVDDWRRYAAAGGERLWPHLQTRLPQLRAPIRTGISKTDAYARLARRGEFVDDAALGGRLMLGPDAVRLEFHEHAAGTLPVLIAATRHDFEQLYRALACRSEPEPVSPAVNAQMIAGLVNWDRVARVREAWADGQDPTTTDRAWPIEMQRVAAGQPDRFYDRVILVCDAPYGGQPARAFDLALTDDAWLRASMRLRIEHEFAHYATTRLYGVMRLNLLDELVADAMGMTEALGGFRAHWFLTALGLSPPQPPVPGARVHTYWSGLSEAAIPVVCALVARAAGTLEACTPSGVATRDRARYLLALTVQTLDGLASPDGAARFEEAWAWAGPLCGDAR